MHIILHPVGGKASARASGFVNQPIIFVDMLVAVVVCSDIANEQLADSNQWSSTY